MISQTENYTARADIIDAKLADLPAYQEAYQAMAADDDYMYYWRATEFDAAGRLLNEVHGNGLSSQYTYDNTNGLMTSQRSGFIYAQDVRHLSYRYDQLNNVIQRSDLVTDVEENFTYDSQDRLLSSTVTSLMQGASYNNSVNYAYDTLGNITYKSDVGSYTYGGTTQTTAGPHAVLTAGGNSYQYDKNGNMINGGGRTLQWSSFNKPTRITKGSNTVNFTYAPDRARYLQTSSDGTKTLYLGKSYELITKGQAVTHKQFIYAGGSLVATHNSGLDSSGAAKPVQTRYFHKDNLGSIDTITDGIGNVVERMSFDPFGGRRQSNWRESTVGINLIPILTNRGFTGHEHLDGVDLIHMNGRVYDTTLGRLLSADPHIQAPYATQSFNRYSYAINNPMKYTDPSGFFFKKLFKSIKKIVSKVVVGTRKIIRRVKTAIIKAVGPDIANLAATIGAAFCGPAAALCYASAQYDIATAYGASQGDAFKSALKAGVTYYISSAAAKSVGATFDFDTMPVHNVIGNGVVGGVMSKA